MKSKIVPCIDCGQELPRKELNRNFRCYDCCLKIMRETALGLQAHSGPHYEKWKQAVKTAAGKL